MREFNPPFDMIRNIGSSCMEDFKSIGIQYMKHFIEFNCLTPSSKVLDLGCGVGRLAIPMTNYITDGSYDGIDIDDNAIKWCQDNITPEFSNFNFKVSEVDSGLYNSRFKIPANEYKLPYNDNEFDFIFLISVFTHMKLVDIELYLSEITRVLKPNGICFITYFLLNNESLQLIKNKKSTLKFIYQIDGGLTMDRIVIGAACAYPEEDITSMYVENRLIPTHPIYYGLWSGREGSFEYQDIIIAKKTI